MKWILVFMMWATVPQDDPDAVDGWPVNQLNSRAIYDNFKDCNLAADQVRISADSAANRITVACVPINNDS